VPSFWDRAFRLSLSLPPPPSPAPRPQQPTARHQQPPRQEQQQQQQAGKPAATKGRFQRPVTSFFKAPATAEEKQRAAEQQAKEVEASRGKLQESAMEREKRQLEKEAYRGPGRPKKNRFFSPPAGMCLGVWCVVCFCMRVCIRLRTATCLMQACASMMQAYPTGSSSCARVLTLCVCVCF
jgi:hypothetical protein